jgi:hypothetical protein
MLPRSGVKVIAQYLPFVRSRNAATPQSSIDNTNLKK